MSRGDAAAGLRIDRVSKRYAEMTALDDVSVEVGDGEFVSLLGPSGCGKTTLLRIVAGFEFPNQGRVTLDGQDIIGLPPYRRPVNTVFQKPVLLPHLDVFENVAFGLRAKGVGDESVAKKVTEMLEVVRLPGFERRRSDELSGGQAQRVNLARALVNRPRVLLLDEPLSALDLQVRLDMQTELKRVHRETGITFLYVTHDQQEAMAMSDRIAVMQAGRIRQIGTSDEIYHEPNSSFVARFVGNANLLPVEVADRGATHDRVRLRDTHITLSIPAIPDGVQEGWISIRPESLRLTAPTGTELVGRVTDVSFLGPVVLSRVAVGTHEFRVTGQADEIARARPGDLVGIAHDPERVRFLKE